MRLGFGHDHMYFRVFDDDLVVRNAFEIGDRTGDGGTSPVLSSW